MYPHFIEVHDVSTGSEQLVHIETIEGIFTEMVASGVYATHIDLVDGDCYQVAEFYDDIKQLIRDCGCAITNKWIRIRDGGPKQEGSYLTVVRYRDGSTCQKIKLWKDGAFTSEGKQVTHWQPLPPDPKED